MARPRITGLVASADRVGRALAGPVSAAELGRLSRHDRLSETVMVSSAWDNAWAPRADAFLPRAARALSGRASAHGC
jgi:hypothetical protein